MTDNRLLAYLKTFKPTELNRLLKFMESRVFNTDETVIKLLQYIIPFLKEGKGEGLARQSIWKHVHGSKKYNDLHFRRLNSDLVLKVESFLAFERYRSNPVNEMADLMAILNERKMQQPFTAAHNYSRKLLDRKKAHDAGYYYDNYRIESEYSAYLESLNQRSAQKNLFQAMQALDIFYLLTKLRHCAAILHYKSVTKFEGDIPLLPELLQHLKHNTYSAHPAVSIYYCIILTLIEPDNEGHFEQLNDLLLKSHDTISAINARDMYAFALNYCVRMINRGHEAYLHKALNLYKNMAANGVLLSNGILSQFDYKNVVTSALRVKDFAFAQQFIEQQKGNLLPAERNNAHTFNLARLYFYRKDYEKAMRLLQTVEYNDMFYQLDAKTTLLKCYYELGEYALLMSLKDSFVKLLRRKKTISEQHRVNYSNFIKFSMKLYRVDVRDMKKVHILKNQIEQSAHIADKTWLLEKTAELAA